MIHMLSSFDLKPGEDWDSFARDYDTFLEDLRAADLIADASPLGRRVSDTPMDTDDTRTHQYFSVISFRDRAQLDAAYAHIDARARPGTETHLRMYRRLTKTVFLCWEDAETGKGTP
ncbi:DUF6614 family protein [Ruegeria atlantica]|uniref:DUF1330 domain-containing protein n=1 Tax=Ruegeria atlantica TaxID=81569 RepID=A0A0P1EFB9_9RHOB|nr:DUF6614 family protein [Ruegeria atlantica]CUH48755.1 hypothetical protein RUA4292_02944 [Ruegeria atlantica]